MLFVGIEQLLPAYNQQFALRFELAAEANRAPRQSKLSVACYPQRFDSASFYLPQAEVRVYNADQRRELFNDLQHRQSTLLLVRTGRPLEELLREFPESVEFVTRGKPGAVTVGWVRQRPGAMRDAVAQR